MLTSTANKIVAVVILLLVIALGVVTFQARRADRLAREARLETTNERARHDTTRLMQGRELEAARKVYGDSVRIATRLLEQRDIERDALDKTVDGYRAATVRLAGQIAALRASVGSSGGVTHVAGDDPIAGATDSARFARFHVRQAPYTVAADVTLPPPPAAGRMNVAVTLDSVTLDARVQCGAAVGGIRPASIVLAGPEWLPMRATTGAVSTRACNPDMGKRPRRWSLGLGGGYGLTVPMHAWGGNGERPTVVGGPSVLLGGFWRIW